MSRGKLRERYLNCSARFTLGEALRYIRLEGLFLKSCIRKSQKCISKQKILKFYEALKLLLVYLSFNLAPQNKWSKWCRKEKAADLIKNT